MLIGIENILKWLRTNKTPYWRIKSGLSEQSKVIYSSKTEDDTSTSSLEDGANTLHACLLTLGPGGYGIEAWLTPGQRKNWYYSNFQITAATHSMAGISGPPAPAGITPEMLQKAIQEALEKERRDRELEDLKRQLKEAKAEAREANTPINRIIGRLESSGLMDHVLPAAKAAPANTNQATEISGDEEQRIGDLMEDWAKNDPDFVKSLEGIVRLAKENPGKYSMAKRML